VCDRSGRLPGRAQEEAGVQRPPHLNCECHASKGSSLLAAWACVCPHMLASSGLCRLGVPFRRRRSGQESTPLFFLFMRHNTSYLCMQGRSLCFILAPERDEGTIKIHCLKVSNPRRVFLWTSAKRYVTHASEPSTGWVRIRYTCREWIFLTSLHRSPWIVPTLSTGFFLCSSRVHTYLLSFSVTRDR
jgi:hypothetical protein